MNYYANPKISDEKFEKRIRWRRKKGLLSHGKQGRRNSNQPSFSSKRRYLSEEE